MKFNFIVSLLLLYSLDSFSQNSMILHKADGTKEHIPLESIQKITFDMSTVSIQPRLGLPTVKKINEIINKVIHTSHLAHIKYSVEKACLVNITVFDVKGRKIHTILNSHMSPGSHSTIWNGTDSNGKKFSAGPYLVNIRAGSKTSHHLLILD